MYQEYPCDVCLSEDRGSRIGRGAYIPPLNRGSMYSSEEIEFEKIRKCLGIAMSLIDKTKLEPAQLEWFDKTEKKYK